MPYRCKCGKAFDLVATLDGLASDAMGSMGMLLHACGACGERTEARLRPGRVELGYNYWAGSLHWEAMHEVRVRGLKITCSDPDDIDIVLGGRSWHFGIRRNSCERFVVLPEAFGAGKRLGGLAFTQWNVDVAGVERAATRLEPSDDLVLAAGDFLTLTGPGPALVRAWQYLNDGKPKSG